MTAPRTVENRLHAAAPRKVRQWVARDGHAILQFRDGHCRHETSSATLATSTAGYSITTGVSSKHGAILARSMPPPIERVGWIVWAKDAFGLEEVGFPCLRLANLFCRERLGRFGDRNEATSAAVSPVQDRIGHRKTVDRHHEGLTSATRLRSDA